MQGTWGGVYEDLLHYVGCEIFILALAASMQDLLPHRMMILACRRELSNRCYEMPTLQMIAGNTDSVFDSGTGGGGSWLQVRLNGCARGCREGVSTSFENICPSCDFGKVCVSVTNYRSTCRVTTTFAGQRAWPTVQLTKPLLTHH